MDLRIFLRSHGPLRREGGIEGWEMGWERGGEEQSGEANCGYGKTNSGGVGVPTSAPGSATVVGCKTVSEKIEKLIWHLFMIIVVTNE
ncbi:unnamed protein product [Enterobius vermicularis]|uniref:Uncharacterized protein n=1 Tax=Enterobius vermicularis TaxID=51028 RepID=A0A0N4VHF6_ENTVE|nr:unnamed protein product [Enterobius vermicularis]